MSEQKIRKLRKQAIKCRARLDIGKETVARLEEEGRWRRGHDLPGGGWEIEFNRGWGARDEWTIWLRVRRSRLLRDAGEKMNVAGGDIGEGWGLYAARKFNAGDAIGKITGAAVGDLGTIGGAEAKAALRAMHETGAGHHAIQVNGRLMDGARAVSGVQYANSSRGVLGRNDNAEFRRTGTLAAEVTIEAGEEILVPWGTYWPKYKRPTSGATVDAIESAGTSKDHTAHKEQRDESGVVGEHGAHDGVEERGAHDGDGAVEQVAQGVHRRIPDTEAGAGPANARSDTGEQQRAREEAERATAAIERACEASERQAEEEADARAGAKRRAAETQAQEDRRRKQEQQQKRRRCEEQWKANRQRALEQRERERRRPSKRQRDEPEDQQAEHRKRTARRMINVRRRVATEWSVRERMRYMHARDAVATKDVQRAADRHRAQVRETLRNVCLDAVT